MTTVESCYLENVEIENQRWRWPVFNSRFRKRGCWHGAHFNHVCKTEHTHISLASLFGTLALVAAMGEAWHDYPTKHNVQLQMAGVEPWLWPCCGQDWHAELQRAALLLLQDNCWRRCHAPRAGCERRAKSPSLEQAAALTCCIHQHSVGDRAGQR